MSYRSLTAVLPRVILFAGILLAVSMLAFPLYNSALAQDDGTIEYAENGMGPVATYTAVDPEMTAIASWSLDGTDAGVFDINDGVLTFKESPDYEMTTDVDGAGDSTAVANDNMYEVTVQATDSTMKMGMKEVMVEVTNEEERGMVTLSALQPQSSVLLTATHTDPDGGISDLKWQWAKSMEMDGTFVDIENADSATYTPADADIEYYLRATAMYTDSEGSGKSAMAMSEYAVQGEPASNSAPDFTGQDEDDQISGIQVTRSVAENTAAGQAVGAPVRAMDGNSDVLTYTLAGTGADDALFAIDWGTGQIMTKSDLNLEDVDLSDRDTGSDAPGKQLEVTVRATDPSGDPRDASVDPANGAEVTVMITVTDVNEPPAFTSGAETYTIDEGASIASDNGYVAADPDTADTADPTWSLSGPDRSKFDITGGALTFDDFTPNYEMPADANMDNTYEVMVVATVGGMSGTRDVKVMVTNMEEAGTVTLNRVQPRAGVSVMATLTDPDGSISGLTWQWYRSASIDDVVSNAPTTVCAAEGADNCVIEGAMSDTYTPTDGDVDETLTAVAMYTDGQDGSKMARGQAANATDLDTRNRAPMFEDQDSEAEGDQSESTTIMVEENRDADTSDDAVADMATDNVGSPINANDPDPNADPLIYTLSGADAGLFRVRQDDADTDVDEGGQIEVAAGTELDYETRRSYEVTVKAEDSFGASDTIMVTIMVTDLDEAPEMTGDAAIEYEENGTGRVATYTAVDPEMTAIASWTLAGTDAGAFDVSNGVLTFKKSPDYEMPTDVDGAGDSTAAADDNMYEVTVQATDSTMKMGMKEVMVEVTNEEERGMVTLSARRPQREVGFTATLTDPDGAPTGITWQWAKSRSRNGSYTDIEGADSATYTPVDPDRNYHLRATAMYTDNEGSGKSAMATSEYAVRGIPASNSAPDFTGQDEDDQISGIQVTRSVAENTAAGQAVGAPVRAMDGNSDVLTYTLAGTGADDALFAIDWGTGQIMTKSDLNLEDVDLSDRDTGSDAPGKQLEVTVRATDPSGDPRDASVDPANGAEVTVMITVTDVNEPPAFTSGAETYTIDEGASIASDNGYVAADPDTADTADPTWSLSGPDRSKFDITGGALTFDDFTPNYEMPADANMDNTYEVMVVATVGGMSGTRDVKVMVTNMEEAGTVTLNRVQPRAGVSVMATLTDPDGSISGLTWQWYRSASIDDVVSNAPTTVCAAEGADNCVIEGAMSDTYTPTDGDVDETLTAVAMYTDGQDGSKMARGQAANATDLDTRNRAPMFEDQDSEAEGDQSESTTIMVEENRDADTSDDAVADMATDNVGSPINANDPDPNADPLIYTLSGADAGLFRVRQDDADTDVDEGGQIEVAAGTELDYEMRRSYEVTVKAEDSFGASDTIMVTIMVTDLDEVPEIMLGGLAISGMSSVYYAENGMGAVENYMATGPDADMASWSLSGDDMRAFSLSNDGMLTFRSSPDYENPTDMGMDNMYMVTITADDGTYIDTHDVMVMVTNEEEAGTLTLSTMRPAVGEEITATLTDRDGGITGTTWQWARSATADGTFAPITGATNAAYTPVAADVGMYLQATASYTDGHGSGKSEMAVSANMVIMAMAGTNTAPMFPAATAERMVDENTAAGGPVGAPVTAMDADNDTLTYSLGGMDMASFDIGMATGQITVGAGTMLDYEATQNTYMVTVTASDGTDSDSIDVMVMVTNEEETGEVTLWAGADALTMAPQVGDTITGAVMDPDGGVTGETWQWARTMTPDVMASWMDIAGETNAAYMVTAGDTGYYLRVMATYTDAVGTDMAMEYSMPTMMVVAEAGDTLLSMYDANDNGVIDLDEVFTAIDDYFDYDDRLTLEEIYEIVDLYFES